MSLFGRLIKAFRIRLTAPREVRGDTSSADKPVADTVSFRGPPLRQSAPDSRAFQDALTRLPDDQRMVASLHYLEGKDLHEIADRLALPSEEVALRLHLALKAMHTDLESAERNCEH